MRGTGFGSAADRAFVAAAAVLLLGASPFQAQPADATTVALLDAERRANRLPGLAAVVVRSGGSPRVYVSGERRVGIADPITPSDRMHLGSLTKAITATLAGALTERGLLTLETTVGATFPELSVKMQPAYRQVTVRQLLTHAAGLPTYGTNLSMLPLLSLEGTPTEQRFAFVARVLAEPPRFEPGTRHEYSSAGAAVTGAMAERVAKGPYRQLVADLVFAPIGARVAFDNPGLAADPQPWGHRRVLGAVVSILPTNPLYTTPIAIEPAGNASPSLPDYGRFLQMHLRGLRGQDDGLKARTIQTLHGMDPASPVRGPAMGWNIVPRDGVATHEHRGSSGAYVAYAAIQPSRDVAVAVFTNLGSEEGLREQIADLALRIAAGFQGSK